MSLLLLNARIRPAPSDGADALRVDGRRIAAVGQTAELIAAAPPDARRLDLGGRVLTPGIQDAHAHFFQMGMVARRPALSDAMMSRLSTLVAA